MTVSDEQEYYDVLCRVRTTSSSLLSQLKFDSSHPWHLHLVLLYCTMIELLGSVCILLQHKSGIAVPVLLRSLLEAQVDFKNLAEDRTYGYHMNAKWLQQWVRLFDEAEKGTNPYLKEFTHRLVGNVSREDFRKELESLKSRGYLPLKQNEKFEKAQLGDVYSSLYNHLCCESHNDIRALMSRHTQPNADGTGFSVHLRPDYGLEELLPEMDTACHIVIESSKVINSILKGGGDEALRTLDQALHSLRQQRTQSVGS